MGDVAASGGIFISVAADTILAQPGTVTGSIGVVTGKFNISPMLQELGEGRGRPLGERVASDPANVLGMAKVHCAAAVMKGIVMRPK